MKSRHFFLVILCALLSIRGLGASKASENTSNKFHQIFTTAAYSTALGGAIGTAVLAFTPRPTENFRFIAIGASIGFLSGILLGGYLAFFPSVKGDSDQNASLGSFSPMYKSNMFAIEASFDKGRVDSLALHFPVLEL